ncbi:hypothetical protein ACA910_006717 [Epithemia clementina (nom. ined.)]
MPSRSTVQNPENVPHTIVTEEEAKRLFADKENPKLGPRNVNLDFTHFGDYSARRVAPLNCAWRLQCSSCGSPELRVDLCVKCVVAGSVHGGDFVGSQATTLEFHEPWRRH